MAKLKLGAIEQPIKLTHELSSNVHLDLVAYAKIANEGLI